MKSKAVIEIRPADDLEAMGRLPEELAWQQVFEERRALLDKAQVASDNRCRDSHEWANVRHILEDRGVKRRRAAGASERRARRETLDELDGIEARLEALDVAVTTAAQARDQALGREREERFMRLAARQRLFDEKIANPKTTLAELAALLPEARAIGAAAQLAARWTPDRQPRWGGWEFTLITSPTLPLRDLARRAVDLYLKRG